MRTYSESEKSKLGNAIVYIAQRVPYLSKTKLLKLLYFMEEYSVRRFQTPFLGLTYEVWQAGPVPKDVFIDLSETPVLLHGYVSRIQEDDKTYIKAESDFCDDEFSDNDIVVMDYVISKYGKKTAKELVRETHLSGTLWYRTAERHGLLDKFNSGQLNNSDIPLDFGEDLTGCGKEFYEDQLEFFHHA